MSERALDLGSTLEVEIFSAQMRNHLREEIRNYAENNIPISREFIQTCYEHGMNFRFEKAQIEAEMAGKKPQGKVDIESLKQQCKKDLELYTSGLSELSREEFNEKYKTLGIKMNMTFKKADVKKVASNAKTRDVQSTQSELRTNYREIETPTQEHDNNISIDDG